MARIVLLGGTGFIGRRTVPAALAAGHEVIAVTRSAAGAGSLRAAGGTPLPGSAENAREWIGAAAGADVLVDLTQPPLPARIPVRVARAAAATRVAGSRALCAALAALPAAERPVLLTASGTDDLQPDAASGLSDTSPLRTTPRGFGHIGVPVRRAIEASGADAAFVYFGNVVYGPGKAYLDTIIVGLHAGRTKVVGDGGNRLPVTSVADAAAALVHLAGCPRAELAGRSFLAVPPTPVTQRAFLEATADALGAAHPGSVPARLAALVAGRVNADVMTLDATCAPTALTASGFRFAHDDVTAGITAALDATTPASL